MRARARRRRTARAARGRALAERVRRAADVKMGMRLDLQRRLTNERLDIPVAAGAGALRELQQAGVRAVTEGEGAEMLAALVHALRLDEEEVSEAEGARRRPGPLCAVPARLFAALRSRL